MMPAAFKTIFLAAERQAARSCRGSCFIGRFARLSAAMHPEAHLRREIWQSPSFASAAFADEALAGEPESRSTSQWLQVDPPPRAHAFQDRSSALGHNAEEVDEEAQLASSGRASSSLQDKEGDDDDLLGSMDWSDAEEEVEKRQTRFSPRGPKPKLKYPRDKPRKGIGKKAVIPPLPSFATMLPRLQAYKHKFGDCLVPKRFWEDFELGTWTHRVRVMLKDKKLPERQFEALDGMGFPWVVPVDVAQWEFLFHEMRRYKEEYGNLEVPFKWKDPMADFNNHFAKWFHAQPTLFLQRRLRPDQVRKLMVAGFDMRQVTGDDIGKADYLKAQQEIAAKGDVSEFEIMFAEMEAWKATYYTTILPRMVYDNPVLGMWAWKVRRDYRKKKLAQWKIDRLDAIEFLWDVDHQTSKWHTNLHEARRYKEVHGTGSLPMDYKNPAEPGWQEAARWLQRQAKLFRKQKLTDKRYRIMREVLGIKFVRQYAPRVQLNRKRLGIVPAPGKQLPKYAPAMKKNVLV